MAAGRFGRAAREALLAASALGFGLAGDGFADALKGVALSIGQADYAALPDLRNTERDANAVEELFDRLGFEAAATTDRDGRRLARDLDGFLDDAEDADVAVLYYAGHAVEIGGENFLVPTDVDASSPEALAGKLVPLSDYVRALQARVPVTIILLDACRDNPFPPGTVVKLSPVAEALPVGANGLQSRGVVALKAPAEASRNLGIVVAFAAEPGKVALDGKPGGNSPYAAALLRHLTAMSGEEFGTVMRMIAEEVYLKTGGKQRPWVNESLRRLLYFGEPAADPTGDEGDILKERRQLLLTIADLPDLDRRQVERVAAQGNVPMDAVYGMLRALGEEAPKDPAELEGLLRRQTETVARLRAERAALASEDPRLRRLVDLADEATSEGALQTAVRLHEQAKARVRELDATVDKAEADLRARRLEFAAVHAGSAEAYLSTFDFERAAADFAEAFRQVERWDDRLAWRYKNEEMLALVDYAEHKGGSRALFAAIDAGEIAAEIGRRLPNSDQWVTSLTNIGNAMVSMSRISGGGGWLEEAAHLYGMALEHAPRESDQRRWAWLQSSIGNIHLTLGERGGTGHLEQAVAAYRSAVDATPRAAAPYDWALFQNNLGNALFRLGGRQLGTESLEAAVIAYRSSLEEFDPETRPEKWALTLNNLGRALHALGQRETGVKRLEEAVEAQRAVLGVQDRATAPLRWATTQNDLGNVLLTLGMRTGETRRFEAAAEAFTQAMTEWRRDIVPVDWAIAMHNLGSVYHFLGRDGGDRALVEKSVDAYRQALEVRGRDASPADWAGTTHNLAAALATLGEFEPGTATLKEAVALYRGLLEFRPRADNPVDWAGTQHNLGRTLRTIGEIEKSPSTLKEAAAAFRSALGEFTRERFGHQWASSQADLGEALLVLGEMSGDREALAGSAEATRAALSGYDFSRNRYQRARTNEYLARATYALGMRSRDVALLAESAAAWKAALAGRDRDADPLAWARAEGSRGLALLELGKRAGRAGALAEARDALTAARQAYATAGHHGLDAWLSARIAEADTLLGFMPR